MKTPNFIIGGTAAGGTSFLSAILVQHPEIYLPAEMRPEPHFFYKSWEYEKGTNYYLTRWFKSVPDNAIAVGERSSSYLFGGKSVAQKIYTLYPDMRFIFTLRNPIQRTWANYRYTVLQGLEKLSFEDALKNESQRVCDQKGMWAEIQPYNYTGRGFYAAQIKQYLQLFSAENILLVKSELLSTQTEIELKRIYKFLNLNLHDFDYVPVPDHTSVSILNPKLQTELREYFGNRFDKVIESIRREEKIEKFIKNQADKEKILLLKNNMTGVKQSIPETERKYLQDLFAEDIAELRSIVNFDLGDWN